MRWPLSGGARGHRVGAGRTMRKRRSLQIHSHGGQPSSPAFYLLENTRRKLFLVCRDNDVELARLETTAAVDKENWRGS